MANEEVNTGRRRFLTATTAVVGAVGAGFAAVPFIKSWSPSARARFAGAPVSQDISALAEGAQLGVVGLQRGGESGQPAQVGFVHDVVSGQRAAVAAGGPEVPRRLVVAAGRQRHAHAALAAARRAAAAGSRPTGRSPAIWRRWCLWWTGYRTR